MGRRVDTYPIDAVITWVDLNDPVWQNIRSQYLSESLSSTVDNSDVRYRDWDTIRFVFRGIERYMPWVRTVHFVTMNQIPKWMNTEAEKLHIVNHADFIPAQYLPTFSSHAIEFNLHRIHGLSEQFIYFNDDTFVTKAVKRKDFFIYGLPRDVAIHTALISSHRGSISDAVLTNMEVINDHFKKRSVIRKDFMKWYNPYYYGKWFVKTALLAPYRKFSYIKNRHMPQPLLKSTFERVWESEPETIDKCCQHKFRTRRDVSPWLIRDWQICTGKFYPAKRNAYHSFVVSNNNMENIKKIKRGKYQMVCINDNGVGHIENFEETKKLLIDALEEIFPGKSSYEK